MKYEELTHKVIGCAMKVHSTLGNGFQEVIYQRALAIEMKKQGLDYQREMEMTIFYEGIDIGTRRVDFFVENIIMVELKAVIPRYGNRGKSETGGKGSTGGRGTASVGGCTA